MARRSRLVPPAAELQTLADMRKLFVIEAIWIALRIVP